MGLIVIDPGPNKKKVKEMTVLTFEEARHQYWLDGKPIDGLTSTIREAGLGWDADQHYLERGKAIHLVTEKWDKGMLDEAMVTDEIMPFLESWIKFRRDLKYTPVEIEFPTYHPELMVGTRIDRLPLLDIKSGGPEKWHVLQLALQWSALSCHGMSHLAKTPMGIYLNSEGKIPKVKLYKASEMREAFKAYSSMLYFLRWRRN